MKKNRGITIITLVITITVILILTSIFIATGIDALNESKKAEIENEIYQLKQAISARYTSYIKNDGDISLLGDSPNNKWVNADECINTVISVLRFEDDLSPEDEEAKKQKVRDEILRDYNTYVKIIDSGDKLKLGLENYSDDKVYVVDYFTGSVYGPINERDGNLE